MAETLKISTQGKGLPLVLIHGWGLNSGVWEPLIPELAENFQVITVDLPGFGLNVGCNITPYSLENIATHIAQTIAKPAIYLGWSLGGLVAKKIALLQPDSILGLVDVTSTPCFVEKDSWPGIKPNVLALFHEQLAEDTHKTITNFLNIQAMGSPNLRQDVKSLKRLITQYDFPSKQTLDDALKLLEEVDLRDELAQLKVPTLALFGKLDTLVPRKVISLIQELMPSSQIHIFTKASHAPFISHKEDFLAVLIPWLLALKK